MDAKMRQMLQGIGLFTGRVLSGPEYSECLAKCGVDGNPEGTNDFPVVAGAFPEFIDALHNRQPMFTRVVAFHSPSARLLLAITLQVGVMQSRKLFDLEAPMTRSMLEAARDAGVLRLLLLPPEQSSEPEASGIEISLPLHAKAVEHLLALPTGHGTATNVYERTADMAMVATRLLQDRMAMLINGQPVPESITVTDCTVAAIETEGDLERVLH